MLTLTYIIVIVLTAGGRHSRCGGIAYCPISKMNQSSIFGPFSDFTVQPLRGCRSTLTFSPVLIMPIVGYKPPSGRTTSLRPTTFPFLVKNTCSDSKGMIRIFVLKALRDVAFHSQILTASHHDLPPLHIFFFLLLLLIFVAFI